MWCLPGFRQPCSLQIRLRLTLPVNRRARGTGARGAAHRRRRRATHYDRPVPERLHFTDSAEADELIARDPLALLIGFALDQQVTVQKAFAGPLVLRERVGTLDAG